MQLYHVDKIFERSFVEKKKHWGSRKVKTTNEIRTKNKLKWNVNNVNGNIFWRQWMHTNEWPDTTKTKNSIYRFYMCKLKCNTESKKQKVQSNR